MHFIITLSVRKCRNVVKHKFLLKTYTLQLSKTQLISKVNDHVCTRSGKDLQLSFLFLIWTVTPSSAYTYHSVRSPTTPYDHHGRAQRRSAIAMVKPLSQLAALPLRLHGVLKLNHFKLFKDQFPEMSFFFIHVSNLFWTDLSSCTKHLWRFRGHTV